MKKFITFLLVLCMMVTVFASCTNESSTNEPPTSETTAPAHEHDFKAEWEKDTTHHWHVCKGEACAETADKAEHTWGEPVVSAAKERVFTCTACGQTKSEAIKTTVSAEEWTAAFDLGTNWAISVSAHTPPSEDSRSMTVLQERDGNKFHYKGIEKNNNTGKESTNENYDEIVGTQWYQYSYDEDLKAYEKELSPRTVEEQLSALMSMFFPAFIQNMESFTYDEAKKAYVATAPMPAETMAIKNFEIFFEDGKLVAITYDIMNGEKLFASYAFTFTYGKTSVTLPTVDETKNVYKVIVIDSNGDRVKGVRIQACKDSCLPAVTNENGVAVIRLDKTEDILQYHITITKLPTGYTGDTTTEYFFNEGEEYLYLFITAPGK
ncbi:MAG: hypothetical protein IKJ35_06700 [Clostridia bacterium]|nr:hypothetical protein [Clostridia bacterium]